MGNVAVIGAGAWGTALATHAARLGHSTRIWAREPEAAAEIEAHHTNSIFLPNVELHASLSASTDVAAVVDGAELVLLVPPSRNLRAVARAVAPHVRPETIIIVASKGIEEGPLALMSDVLADAMPSLKPECRGFLSGPSFAREVAEGLPTDVVVASTPLDAALATQQLLHAPRFRVYTSSDPIGVQIGGAIKNVIAVAAGACDGLGLGANARAALITRGLAEITRLAVALGGDPLTMLGLAGVGDLVLTCTGTQSRNHTLGEKVAQGVSAAEYVARPRAVAEGYWTAKAAHALAVQRGIDMPITEQVYQVLHEGRPLFEALESLLRREGKSELHGIRSKGTE